MKIYPVIDIKDGKCVRTRQEKYYDIEVYSHFPEKVAKELEAKGATYLHVIDLDGAVVGHSSNEECIKELIEAISIPVQLGGGIRSIKDIDQALRLGAKRVVIEVDAVQNPAFIKEAINIFGTERLVISIDLKNNAVMREAWKNTSAYTPLVLAKLMKDMGIKNIIVFTDVEREGMMQGANIEFAKELITTLDMDFIISGGIASLKDIEMLQEIGAAGVLLGASLYEHRIDLTSAIEHLNKRP